MMLRAPLANTAAAKNMIPLPPEITHALSFEIIFDSHSGRSTTDASDSQFPIGRSGGNAPDSRFPSLEVFERRPCLRGQQWLMKGRHPKTFTIADIIC
jgi:hypothetical protein